MTILHIHLFNGMKIQVADQPAIELHQPRLQLLAGYLLVHRQRALLRQHLAFLFWPDSTEAQARTNLRKLLHTLRSKLPNADEYLELTTETVRWRADASFTLDVMGFEAALEDAQAAQAPDAKRRALAQAIALYAGDFLPGHYDEWVLVERERLRHLFGQALTDLAVSYEEAGALDEAMTLASRLLSHDPLQESSYRLVMRLHLLKSEPGAALRVYHTCATLLREELGIDPSPATQELYQRVLAIDADAAASTEMRTAGTDAIPLVGRSAEWQILRRRWADTQRGAPGMVVIQGEPGIGKTRLAEELAEMARRLGCVALHSRAYAAEGGNQLGTAYAPIADLLRSEQAMQAIRALEPAWRDELMRILPELDPTRAMMPAPMTEDWQRYRFHEALARGCLAIRQPLLLHFDDLQWFDGETLAWLHFLLRYEADVRLLVVGTLRHEELDDGHPYHRLQHELARQGVLHTIELKPLLPGAVTQLAEIVMGQAVSAEASDRLYRNTEGNPLFVVESMRAALEAAPGDNAWDVEQIESAVENSGTWPRLPPKVQAVIQARLAQLSPQSRALARVGAVIGRHFTVALLQLAGSATGQTETELITCLDELWKRRIVREHGVDAYDFSHDRIRDAVYAEISPVLRPHLHRRVAEALVSRHQAELDSVSSQIAGHYELAGKSEAAMTYYRRAGDYAAARFANEEAIRYYERVLALVPEDDYLAAYELRWACEAVYALGKDSGRRLENLTCMAELARILTDHGEGKAKQEGLTRQAAVAARFSETYRFVADYQKAKIFASETMCLAELADAPQVLVEGIFHLAYSEWGLGKMDVARADFTRAAELAHSLQMDDWEANCLEHIAQSGMFSGMLASEIQGYLQQCMLIHKKNGQLQGQVSILNKIGYLDFAQGVDDYTAAIAALEEGVALSRRIGAAKLEPALESNLGLTHVYEGNYREAILWLKSAHQHTVKNSDPFREGVNLNYTGELYMNQGRFAEARQCYEESIEVLQAVGGDHGRTRVLCDLGYLYYLIQGYAAALETMHDVIRLARVRQDRRFEANALVRLGHVYLALEQLDKAREVYEDAYAHRQAYEQVNRSMEALIGLAQIAWLAGDKEKAQQLTEQVTAHILAHRLDRTIEGLQVYVTCYRLLIHFAEPRAADVLALARREVEARAATLEDDVARQAFWTVPLHREVYESTTGLAHEHHTTIDA
jgi:DNA-binding SARP family transcriptional activator/tetratricopeptide (TPR) repeat protein